MNTPPFQFQCPHCTRLLEIEAQPTGQSLQCPVCGGELRLDQPTPPTSVTRALLSNLTGAALWRSLSAILTFAVFFHLVTRNRWLTLAGALFGYLYGQRRNRRAARMLANEDWGNRQKALAGLRGTIFSWILLIPMWAWVLTRPPEAFHDQGGLLLTFLVYPLTLALWILGGPVAFVRGWGNRWRTPTPAIERWVVCGLILSGLLTLSGLAAVSRLALR